MGAENVIVTNTAAISNNTYASDNDTPVTVGSSASGLVNGGQTWTETRFYIKTADILIAWYNGSTYGNWEAFPQGYFVVNDENKGFKHKRDGGSDGELRWTASRYA